MESDNSSTERVGEFKYFGTNPTDQNSIEEEIKNRLKSGNACFIRRRTFCLPVCFINIQINVFRNIILPVDLYGCETWSLTFREELMIKV
jgi:hypothetical protein